MAGGRRMKDTRTAYTGAIECGREALLSLDEKRHVRFDADNRKSAVFLDLDGTFWDRENVEESTWRAIHKAQENGHLVFVNTGRTPDGIPQFLWEAGMNGFSLCTGMILCAADGTVLESNLLDADQARAMENYLISQNSGYALEQSFVSFHDEQYARRRAERFKAEGRVDKWHSKPMAEMKSEDYNALLKIIFDTNHEFPIEPAAAKMGYDLLVYESSYTAEGGKSGKFSGELTDARKNKAKSMPELLRVCVDNPQDYRIVAMGDSTNDVSMLAAAEIGVAMGNGSMDVKETAEMITDDIHEDGLYNAFERLGLLKM